MAGISELERQAEEAKTKKLLTPEEVIRKFVDLLRSVSWKAKTQSK